MSNSPFAAFANSTLRFQVASGTLVTNPSNGNRRPGKTVVEVSAMLTEARSPQRERRPGVDTTSVYLTGNVVDVVGASGNPLLLPSVVTPDSRCNAAWNGIQGEFFMDLVERSPFGDAEILGDELRGYFQPSSFAIEGDSWPAEPDSSGLIKVAFAWNDATPKPIYMIPSGQTVFTAQLVIQEPFNGIGSALKLGDLEVSDRLIRADQNDPTLAAEYETNPGHTYGTATQLYLTITPGAGCTQGSGFVVVEV